MSGKFQVRLIVSIMIQPLFMVHDYDLRGEAVQLQSCEDGRSLVSAGRLHSPLPLVQVSFAIFQEGKVAAFISLGNKGVV